MPNVHANGMRLSYEDNGGAGEPVVLLHGFGLDARIWPSQWFALREAGYRVIRYDRRGHGRSDVPDWGYTPTNEADDLRDLLDRLDIGSAHLVGFGAGATVALHFALDHPGRTRSLCLLAPELPAAGGASVEREALAAAARAEGWRGAATRLWLPLPLFDRLRGNPAAFQAIREIVLDHPAGDLLASLVEDEPQPAADRLDSLRAPLLILVGDHEQAAARRAAARIGREAPRARLLVVPDAGHFLPVERPAEVNRLLLALLADPARMLRASDLPLCVRPLTSGDARALASLDASSATDRRLRLAWEGEPLAATLRLDSVAGDMGGVAAIARPAQWWLAHLAEGDLALVALRGETVVGGAVAEVWPERGLLWLTDLRVERAERFRGVARALVAALGEQARAAGLRALRAEGPGDNLDALACLQRLGFRLSGVDDGLLPPTAGEPAPLPLLFLTADLDDPAAP